MSIISVFRSRLLLSAAPAIAFVFVFSVTSGASAADTAERTGEPPSNWSGYHFGVTVGYTGHKSTYEDVGFDWYGSTHDYYSQGVSYGFQAGRDWQSGAFVHGLQLDYSVSDNHDVTVFSSDNLVTNDVEWMASLRARGGLGIGRSLLYYTAGLAVADFDRSWVEANDPSDSWFDLGDTKLGFVGGIGFERMIDDNWSWNVEATLARFQANSSINGDGFIMRNADTVANLKFGINYRLGGYGGHVKTETENGTPFDFSGSYWGAGGGYHAATISLSDITYDYFGSTYEHHYNHVTASIFAGHNWQAGAAVYGVEAELAWLGGSRDFTAQFGNGRWENSADWVGNIKFRSGVAAGDTLMYVLGGVAIGRYSSDFDYGFGGPSAEGTELGLILGAGVEHAITPEMTARIEATYTELGGDEYAPGPGSIQRYRPHLNDLAIRGSLSWFTDGRERETGGGIAAPSADWSGLYAGLDLMAVAHTTSIFDRVYYDHGGSYNVPSLGAGAGVHVGINWQDESFVTGIVADFAWLSNDESDVAGPNYREISSSVEWMATVRGRAGIATGDSLLYVTGGAAFAEVASAYEYIPGPDPESFRFDESRVGWVAGVGAEHRVSENGSWKLEALYADLGSEKAFNGRTCANDLVSESCGMEAFDSNFTIKLGYSHKF